MKLPDLRTTFAAVCKPEKAMNFHAFMRLCLNCAIVDEDHCTETQLRHIFDRSKPTGVACLTCDEFENSLIYIAKKKGVSALTVFSQVARSSVPPVLQNADGRDDLVRDPLTGRVMYTTRTLIPKVYCSIPPTAAPKWTYVPKFWIDEIEGKKEFKRVGVYFDIPKKAKDLAVSLRRDNVTKMLETEMEVPHSKKRFRPPRRH